MILAVCGGFSCGLFIYLFENYLKCKSNEVRNKKGISERISEKLESV